MSAHLPPRLLRFFLVTAGLIIVLSILWSLLDSGYNGFLADVASSVVSEDVTVEEREGTITFTRWERVGGLKRLVTDSIDGYAIHFGLILVVSLIAATPGLRLGRRFLFMGVAAALIVALHIITVLVIAQTGFKNDPLQTLFVIIGVDLFPALLWALFSLRYWLPRHWKAL